MTPIIITTIANQLILKNYAATVPPSVTKNAVKTIRSVLCVKFFASVSAELIDEFNARIHSIE